MGIMTPLLVLCELALLPGLRGKLRTIIRNRTINRISMTKNKNDDTTRASFDDFLPLISRSRTSR